MLRPVSVIVLVNGGAGPDSDRLSGDIA